MRRLALLFAGCAVWLFLAAIPAFADGGPHVASVNNGSGGLTADSCAGCHRAHTAQTDTLLMATSTTALCISCHGVGATGATTNVVHGIQYVPSTADASLRGTGVILGALRNGGFSSATIGSDSGYRLSYASGTSVRAAPKVPVKKDVNGNIVGQGVTSKHFDIDDPEAVLTAWGNGANSATVAAGGSGSMDCATCHNPHGNNQYRILQTEPELDNPSGFTQATTPAIVTDAALPPSTNGVYTDTRNYTVIQTLGGTGTLLASQAAAYSNIAGDYLHRYVPWNARALGQSYAADAPNGIAGTFDTQISAWCATCHTRYLAGDTTDNIDANNVTDALYHNRHRSNGGSGLACTTCHVAHGSNAQMTGTYSTGEPWPGSSTASGTDSRLLKLDNRGTCQACHDPTGTIAAGTSVGPTPNPYTP